MTEAWASTKVDNAVRERWDPPGDAVLGVYSSRSVPDACDQVLSVSPSFGPRFETRSRTTAGTARGRVFDDQTLAVCSQLGIRPEDLGE